MPEHLDEKSIEVARARRARRRRGVSWFRYCLFMLAALALAACDPLPAVSAGNLMNVTPTTRVNDPQNLVYRYPRTLPMRGDPDFDVEVLTEEQRIWHERLDDAADSDDGIMDIEELAKSDDAYHYGRALFTHNHSLLLGLRATGDLEFLDEVDEIMQIVREQLEDGWCGDVRDRVREKGPYTDLRGEDGYLNFRRRHDDDAEGYCRDITDLEEALVHGHIAMVMYAYHLNRDLESPEGIDYGERADFWFDYLLNHFEPKWRERSGREFPRMDFIDLKFCHTFNTFLLYYYYMGMRLQDEGSDRANEYLDQARLMTNQMFEVPYVPRRRGGGFMPTSTPLGEAVVYSFAAPGLELDPGDPSLEACPTTYARYMVPALVQLRLEGFYRWDDVIMSKLARGLAHFVFDTEEISARAAPFAAGVTGDETVERIPSTDYRNRFDVDSYAISALANLGPWNDSGRIAKISHEVYERIEPDPDDPNNVHLPASFLLAATLEAMAQPAEPSEAGVPAAGTAEPTEAGAEEPLDEPGAPEDESDPGSDDPGSGDG